MEGFMAAERTQKVSPRYLEYLRNHAHDRYKKRNVTPVDALTFDLLELSGNKETDVEKYQGLTSLIIAMPKEEVAGKMKKYLDSFPTIDEAFVEKLLMEIL